MVLFNWKTLIEEKIVKVELGDLQPWILKCVYLKLSVWLGSTFLCQGFPPSKQKAVSDRQIKVICVVYFNQCLGAGNSKHL